MQTFTGGCLCGWVRYRAHSPAANPHTCSCRTCQQHTGALTAAWVEFARERVEWTGPGGVPSTFRSSDCSSRAFCAQCGSTLGALDDAPTVALLLGGFDTPWPQALMPEYHAYADGCPAGWHPPDATPQAHCAPNIAVQ